MYVFLHFNVLVEQSIVILYDWSKLELGFLKNKIEG